MGIRFKFLLIFVSSITLALICVTISQSFLVNKLSHIIGDPAVFEEKYSFYYVVVFLLLTSFIFYLLSRKMIQRIEHINRCVNTVSEGNWNIHIQSSSHDEIGNLGRQINNMLRNLRELREREQAAEHLKTEMIANISHDLRTPVTSLLGYIELMKNNLDDPLEDREKYIGIAERKCQELKGQIHDLLELSILSHQENILHKEKVEVKEFVQQVLIDFVPQLERADMDFHIYAPAYPIHMTVDVGLFVRMLQNMISNTINYGAEGKKLDIHIANIREEVVITLVNYGKEIPQEMLPYIFERFYRGEKSRNMNTGGKGLGLAISKSIAVMHGGNISVESNAESTRFIITIPV